MKLKKPYGYSIHLGINSKFYPTLIVSPIQIGTIRPKTIEIPKLFKTKIDNVSYFGLRIDLLFGTLRRPIPKIWKKEFWLRNAKDYGDTNYVIKESTTNPWNSGNHWFVLTIPIMPAFFVSACLAIKKVNGKLILPGFYVGFKSYLVDYISSQLLNYETQEYQFDKEGNPIFTWASKEEQGNQYLAISGSIRSDLIEN